MKYFTSLLFICFYLSIPGCSKAPPTESIITSGFSSVPYFAYYSIPLGTRVYDQWSKVGVTFSDILDTNSIMQIKNHYSGKAKIRLIVDYNNSKYNVELNFNGTPNIYHFNSGSNYYIQLVDLSLEGGSCTLYILLATVDYGSL
ncbi:MAG: hypothetical protein P4L27_09990 [Ignavibacteriaceae bacterium]|nr:hypothetical protein [Ignavibacteriaceae bacterium]